MLDADHPSSRSILNLQQCIVELIGKSDRLLAIHDQIYTDLLALSGGDDSLVTAEQMALIFDRDPEEIQVLFEQAADIITSRDFAGRPAISLALARELIGHPDPTFDPNETAVQIVRALADIPNMTAQRMAFAAGLPVAQINSIRDRLKQESQDIIRRMTTGI